MNREIWLISDTHWHHANMLNFEDTDGNKFRGDLFSSVEEMDEAMVDNWNSVVKEADSVYHLGDVTMNPKKFAEEIYPRLKGKKRLIVGNHDDIKKMCQLFPKVMMWRNFSEMNLLLTHIPLHESNIWNYKKNRPMRNVHGHIHQNPSPTEYHYNVSVENINYTPINIEELRV